MQSATNESNWPTEHSKEVCFIGRSNVGKSSLINALANTNIARTSNTPGRTQLINFFQEDKRVYVDLPGYGYAKMPKKVKHKMMEMIEHYLLDREQLKKVFLLVDAKVGPTRDDVSMINFLNQNNLKFMIIMTKGDKPKQSELHKSTLQVKGIHEDSIIISSHKGNNIAKLNKIIKSSF